METVSLDFMNSDWRDYRGGGGRADRLRDPKWLEAFLAQWDLDVAAPPAGEGVYDSDALVPVAEPMSAGRPGRGIAGVPTSSTSSFDAAPGPNTLAPHTRT